MTTELEKRFFQTFDIKPKYQDTCTVEEKYWANEELANEYGTFDRYMDIKCGNQENCTTECSCAYQKEIYPQITDRHCLELICLYNRHDNLFISSASEIENLKIHILSSLVSAFERENTDELKNQVQAIFGVER
ncbi:MAG: hypothetical protein IKU37_08775 [Candidatus Gastranaerophilales bacterium]|nr:hypothetical protein [Candidatus Gastranaerophilales bacterium]